MANDTVIILDEAEDGMQEEDEVQFLGTGKLDHHHNYVSIHLRFNSYCYDLHLLLSFHF